MPLRCRVALLFGCMVWTPGATCPDDADVDLCDDPGYFPIGCPDDPEVDLCDDGFWYGCPDDPEVDLCEGVDYVPAPAPAPGGGGGLAGGGCPDDPDVDLCEGVTTVPNVVTLTMAMTVEDPAAFVADDANKVAVEAGIAGAAGVTADKVDATLTVGSSRRLQTGRRMQGTVDVSAEIEAENAADVATLQESVNAIAPEAMTDSINDAMMAAGLPNVTAIADLAAAVPDGYVAPGTGGGGSDDDFAVKPGLSLLGVAILASSILA